MGPCQNAKIMPNLCQNARNMPGLCQKVRKAKNMPFFDRKGQSWHNGRKWEYYRMPNLCKKMPNLCQSFVFMPDSCQTARKANNMPYFNQKGQSWHNRRKWEYYRMPNLCKKCQIYAKVLYLCQIHARRSGKPVTCHISTRKVRVGIIGANETISSCQSDANFMPKCHSYARFMRKGQESQNHAIFRPERAELA